MQPAPVRSSSRDGAYAALKQRILDNALPPGGQFLEQELVDLCGVSRTPVREALIRLQEEGLVAIVPRHGVRILPLALADMQEIYDVLASLEPTAVALVAARRPGEAELAPFDAACREMAAALARDDLEAWARADEDYHLHLLRLCGNRRLAGMVMQCWDQAHRARMFTLRLRPKPSQSVEEHAAVVDAIRRGDAEGAREIYRRHRERGGREQMEILRRHGMQRI
ncbi:DNA-binding GntR family transcriptional regulator [Stella humosa]|uniref:DNA-binding GntR family transcriptional regulator n=1 Tax=Stella humosa TaxID=94 RepID=A0A3N1M6A8_9PROT|nr:GntR family transcriptional regulator [Stella humosa]ROQ01362.1 DNA-binding GntR family transcriptional regulator [Stella humosa]BBK31736.1 GntR family transcriptional regulator [Stella humosa]